MKSHHLTLLLTLLVTASGCTASATHREAPTAVSRVCFQSEKSTPETRRAAIQEVTDLVAKYRAAAPATLTQELNQLGGTLDLEPNAVQGDLDADGKPDTVVTFGGCDLPALVYLGANPTTPVLPPPHDNWVETGRPQGLRVRHTGTSDLTSDGKPELFLAHWFPGASAGHWDLYIHQWTAQGFRTIFHDHLTDHWVGPNRWMVDQDSITVQCYPFGPYEYKMTYHRHQTEVYRWNPSTERYELAERSITPVKTRLQQVAAAERLFQNGRYEEAIPLYRKVADISAEGTPAKEPDWVAYSHLRVGHIHALAGRQKQALAELKRATRGEEPVASLAAAFQEAYTRQGTAAAGFNALWQWAAKHAYTTPERDVLSDDWPLGFDPHTLGARRAMLDAYRQAGQAPSHDLPEPKDYPPKPDCLTTDWG